MSFRELSLLKYYKTYKNNIVKEFYIPVLKNAVLYQRSVGFFSSTALIELTKGISGLVKNDGKIQFIVSPYLNAEDVEAIEKGYEKRNIIENALLREWKEPENYFQDERLNLLAHLIENGTLEIDKAELQNAALSEYAKEDFSSIKNFANSLVRKMNQISINPMDYVDKTVVAYKNPGKNYATPYITSAFSGMLFNYYC